MINLIKGDITTIPTDIIVTAANRDLIVGAGVNAAIHRKAGVELINECRIKGKCPAGEAVMTDAYNLDAKKVIHTVGPMYINGKFNEAKILRECYISTLSLAEKYRRENNLDIINITIPCISTGIFKYPIPEASRIAVNTVKKLLSKFKNINVIFVCFDDENYNAYKELLNGIN